MSTIQRDNPGQTYAGGRNWREKVRFRKAAEDDLREIEWDGAYTKYRRVYQNVYERSMLGLAVMWVIELPGFGLIGQAFVQLKMNDPNFANGRTRAYLHSFRVRPAMRNHGLGTELMRMIEQDLLQRGFRELTLNVARENKQALQLYERLGYNIIKKISGKWSFYDDQGKLQNEVEPGYRLMKVLTAPKSEG